MRGPQITDEELAVAVALLDQGVPLAEAARTLGRTREGLYRQLRKLGLPTAPKRLDPEVRRQAIVAAAETHTGLTREQIRARILALKRGTSP